MAIVSLSWPDEQIREVVGANSIIKCDLGALNAQGKERIRFLVAEVLSRFGADDKAEDLYMSVMELAFNAIKANYAYIMVLDKIRRLMNHKADQVNLAAILDSSYMSKMYSAFLGQAAIKEGVKEFIAKEGAVFRMQGRAAKEGRELTEEEQARVADAMSMMNRSIADQVKATLSLSHADKRIIIDVINDAPITVEGLERINSRRSLFRDYFERDMVGEFYMENLDDTESAGFGAAMIDSRLLGWGLDPEQHFRVMGLNKKTCATLTVVL